MDIRHVAGVGDVIAVAGDVRHFAGEGGVKLYSCSGCQPLCG